MTPPVLERAHIDIARNELWLARERLQGYIGSQGYHRDVVELLGRVCWQMGDVPAAGRYWFFTPLDAEEKRAAVEQLVRRSGGQSVHILAQLPRALRCGRWTGYPIEVQKRLEALVQPRPGQKKLRRRRPPKGAPRSQALDALAFGVLAVIGVFFLYCFSLGVAQLVNTL